MLKKFASFGFEERNVRGKRPGRPKRRAKYSLFLLLTVAQLPCSAFYYRVKKMCRVDKYANVKTELAVTYRENKE